MAVAITPDYGYVTLVVVFTSILHVYMGACVGKARKKYKVFYPTMYAVESENKQAKEFNCVQRGHQNFLEFVPFFLALLLVSGLKHPKVSAILGVGYLIARVFYFEGYSTGEPKNRLKIGGLHFLFLLGLLIGSVSCSITLLQVF